MMHPDLGAAAMQIVDALEDAAQQMEQQARYVRDQLSRDGFTADELGIMRRLLREKQAFYTQSHLIGVALEQLLDETAPIAITTQGVHAAITELREAEGDLIRVEAVAAKIDQALSMVVKLAARLHIALP